MLTRLPQGAVCRPPTRLCGSLPHPVLTCHSRATTSEQYPCSHEFSVTPVAGVTEPSPLSCQQPQPREMHFPAALALASVMTVHAAGGAAWADTGAEPGDAVKADDDVQPQKERRRRLKPRELGRLLHMSDEAAVLLIERVPELVHHPINRLQAALKRLAAVLQVDDKVVCSLAIKQPRVLLIPPNDVSLRLSALKDLLKVKEDQARDLVQQQPGLLSHQPEVLRARLAALVTLIKESVAQDEKGIVPGVRSSSPSGSEGPPLIANPTASATIMCQREPGLLTHTHSQLAQRVTALSTALGSPTSLVPGLQLTAQAPTALLLPPSRTAALVSALAMNLSLPTRAAGQVLIRLPNLLTVRPDALAGTVRGLALALGVERESAAIMCAKHPALLLIKADDIAARLKALQEALDTPADRVKMLVTDKPQLLLKDPAAVKAALSMARKRGELPPR